MTHLDVNEIGAGERTHGRPVPLPPGNGVTSGTLLMDDQWQAVWKITKAGIKPSCAFSRSRGSAAVTSTAWAPKA